MKKIALLLATLLLLASIVGCSDSPASSPASEKADSSSVSEPVKSDVVSEESSSENSVSEVDEPIIVEEITIEETVIFDQEGITVTAMSLSDDSFMGPEINLLIENKGEQDATVQVRDFSVNGMMVDTMISETVAVGKKVNGSITMMSSDLETAGIETFKDIEFKLHIFNSDSWDTIVDSDIIKLTTTADPSFVQTFDDSGEVLLEQDGVKVVLKELDSEDSFWGADLYLYIENNTDKDITIQVRDTSVNDFMIDAMFSCDIMAGKKAFDSITFLDSQLEENGIEDFEKLELKFHVFEASSWDGIFDSDAITVTF